MNRFQNIGWILKEMHLQWFALLLVLINLTHAVTLPNWPLVIVPPAWRSNTAARLLLTFFIFIIFWRGFDVRDVMIQNGRGRSNFAHILRVGIGSNRHDR